MCGALRFRDDESGEVFYEWVVVVIILLLAVVVALSAMSGPLQNILDIIRANLQKAVG